VVVGGNLDSVNALVSALALILMMARALQTVGLTLGLMDDRFGAVKVDEKDV
jgi:hypothetical protein